MFKTSVGAAGLSIISNSILVVLKLGVGLVIGSVSVISEALHSGTDLLASLITFFSLRIAVRPADESHPFGHGKVEGISGYMEALLILLGAAFIVYAAVSKIVKGVGVSSTYPGIAVMGVSVVTNILVSRHLLKVAKREDSLALEADARHLTADVYTSLGVMLGLVVVQVTGFHILDPLIAMAVAFLIVRTALKLMKRAFVDLVDTRLPEEEIAIMRVAIDKYRADIVEFHELRTRKSGRERQVDLHLLVCKTMSVGESHRLTERLEEEIKSRLDNCVVTVHVEPCDLASVPCPRCGGKGPSGSAGQGARPS